MDWEKKLSHETEISLLKSLEETLNKQFPVFDNQIKWNDFGVYIRTKNICGIGFYSQDLQSDLVPSSLAGTKQKLDFMASTADDSAWQASVTVEISILAEFVAEGWVESPQEQGGFPSPGVTSGFGGAVLIVSLFIPIIYHKTRKRR